MVRFEVELPRTLYELSENHRYIHQVRRGKRGKLYAGHIRNPKVVAWEALLTHLCRCAVDRSGDELDPPLLIEIYWVWPRVVHPDASNMRKAIHDAIARAIEIDDREFLGRDVGSEVDPARSRIEVTISSISVQKR